MILVILVALTVVQSLVLCQPEPEIVNEIIPEVISKARLNCNVVNVQPGQVVMWFKLTNAEIISFDETINDENNICMDGSKKYEISRREVDGRVTYMLVISCLDDEDYGLYKCFIRIMGEHFTNWPFKVGYLLKP